MPAPPVIKTAPREDELTMNIDVMWPTGYRLIR